MFGKWKINKVYGATLAATYEPKNIQVNEKELPRYDPCTCQHNRPAQSSERIQQSLKAVILRTR